MSNVPPPPPPPGFGQQPPPGYGPPGGYGVPGYGSYPTNQREHPNGMTVLLLGILGLVLCQVVSPIAWVMGGRARKDMAAEPGVVWSNAGNITAGWICGIIGTALLALGAAIMVILFVAVVAGA